MRSKNRIEIHLVTNASIRCHMPYKDRISWPPHINLVCKLYYQYCMSKHINQTQQHPSPSQIIRHKYFSLIKITIPLLLCEDCKFTSTKGKTLKIIAVVCRRKNRLQRKTNNIVIFHQMKEWFYMKTFPTRLSYLVCTSQFNWRFSPVFPHTIFLLQIKTVYVMAVVLIQTELTGFWYFFTPEW